MALEQLKIREIVKQAVSKNVDIPEFQREFVWDAEQVKFLAESLYRDYPVGSFLLWDTSDYREAKTAQGTQASLWIVDGQQRTTALCLLLGQKPYWWDSATDWNKMLERYDVMVNILPEDGNDRLEFALPDPIRRHDPRWISIRRALSTESVEAISQLAEDIVARIKTAGNQGNISFGKVHARLHHLWQIRERDIPIIKIGHEVEDVAEIFARLNQAGTRVKEADVMLALAAVRNPGWVREEYLPFRDGLEDRGWELDAGVFIRTMTGIGHGRARLVEVPRDFWDQDTLHPVWKATAETVSDVVKRLAEFGLSSSSMLPSKNSLTPLFVLQYRFGARQGYSFGKALRWFLLANRDGRYSGSAITALNEDVRAITEAAHFGDAIDSLNRKLRISPQILEEEFLNRYDRSGSRFLRLVLYLALFRNDAIDWVDGVRIGYDKTGSPLVAGFEPQWHHIYPRSVLKSAHFGDDEINVLSNITVMNERTNVNKFVGKEPWRYIFQYKISGERLHTHLIPGSFIRQPDDEQALKRQWAINKYTDFYIERAKLLAKEVNTLLRALDA